MRYCAMCSIFIHEANFNKNIQAFPNGLMSTAALFMPAPTNARLRMPTPRLTSIPTALQKFFNFRKAFFKSLLSAQVGSIARLVL